MVKKKSYLLIWYAGGYMYVIYTDSKTVKESIVVNVEVTVL